MRKRTRSSTSHQLDSPWKDVLDRFFPQFMAFFFPDAAEEIDWTRGYEFLDKELRQIQRGSGFGRRLVDKLVKVWRKDGTEAWAIIHVEVQNQTDLDFSRRMYVYNYRAFDRYGQQVASFGVLGDSQQDWRPDQFGYTLWGSEAGLRFPVVKLMDYEAQWGMLESDANLFAVVVMAHLRMLTTRRNAPARLEWKLRLAKSLYQRGYAREDIIELFRFVDWVLTLPEELAQRFDEELQEFEEEQRMPYVTHIERSGIERGRREGQQEEVRRSIRAALETRFQTTPPNLAERLEQIKEIETLRALLKSAILVATPTEFEQELERQ